MVGLDQSRAGNLCDCRPKRISLIDLKDYVFGQYRRNYWKVGLYFGVFFYILHLVA